MGPSFPPPPRLPNRDWLAGEPPAHCLKGAHLPAQLEPTRLASPGSFGLFLAGGIFFLELLLYIFVPLKNLYLFIIIIFIYYLWLREVQPATLSPPAASAQPGSLPSPLPELRDTEMNLNFTSSVHPVSAPRPTSFFIEDILLHKPKPLREVPPEHFPGSLASRVPLLDYGYPLMPTPTLLAPHPHPALHKPEHHHHHPYFLTTSGKCSPSQEEPAEFVARWCQSGDLGPGGEGWVQAPPALDGTCSGRQARLGRLGTFRHPSQES